MIRQSGIISATPIEGSSKAKTFSVHHLEELVVGTRSSSNIVFQMRGASIHLFFSYLCQSSDLLWFWVNSHLESTGPGFWRSFCKTSFMAPEIMMSFWRTVLDHVWPWYIRSFFQDHSDIFQRLVGLAGNVIWYRWQLAGCQMVFACLDVITAGWSLLGK